jgi:hypothetical protein
MKGTLLVKCDVLCEMYIYFVIQVACYLSAYKDKIWAWIGNVAPW